VLGASYKPGVGDVRESPALRIMDLLQARGAEVRYHDPYVAALPGLGLTHSELDAGLDGADLAVIVTAHPGVDHAAVVQSAPRVVDFRGVVRRLAPAPAQAA
jgi:UDP-N-acetyl-D-glucosamine dehydrogenase